MITIDHKVKNEIVYMLVFLVLEIILFKIIFNKESFSVVLKLALSLFWLFILPGFMLMYLFIENLNFIERMIAGIVLGLAFMGIIGYNLGVLGLVFKYQVWIVPIAGIVIGVVSLIRNKSITF